ncbi:TetR/AcrR family transcriptional regulator [Streptomyces himalayensis]|uniref:Tetracyclin repressor-like C-terminal domain-containing protein n=1 Tax=Streptomyces himalayensis subsp. himalayensis TaxID=2756131 RepID=A0A7W0DV03_9ACTN|nr:hypothetical protein [Streptomyces himalayensis]MBA2951806.1 hypothetical protein [Streptomyces himalayensis subsp. himalayensis]
MARTFLSFWEDESTRPALVAVYRTSLSDEATAKGFRDQIEAAFASCLGRIAPEETERTPAFTFLVSAQLAGLVMLVYVLAVEPLASLDFEELMEWLVPAIEVHFDRLPQEQMAGAPSGQATAEAPVRTPPALFLPALRPPGPTPGAIRRRVEVPRGAPCSGPPAVGGRPKTDGF